MNEVMACMYNTAVGGFFFGGGKPGGFKSLKKLELLITPSYY